MAAAPEPLSFEEIFHGGIHPENLIGVAEKVVGAQPSGHLDGAKGKLATGGAGGKDGGGQAAVAERAAALVRKKEEEALRAELAKRDQEAWGDKMPPPNKVVEAAFLSALPSAEDVFGSIQPAAATSASVHRPPTHLAAPLSTCVMQVSFVTLF